MGEREDDKAAPGIGNSFARQQPAMGEREDDGWHKPDSNWWYLQTFKTEGPFVITGEELYQAFKARLMRELVAARDVSATMGSGEPGTFVAHYPLVALRSGEREGG